MTNEEAINTLKSLKSYYNDNSEYCEDGYVGFDSEDNEALDRAIKALEQQSSCNCVSRDTLKSAVSELTYWHPTTDGRLEVGGAFDNTVYKVEDVWRLTRELPSVTLSISKGEWLHIYKSGIACECSRCHIQMPITEYYHFCPNCGAFMMESEESE